MAPMPLLSAASCSQVHRSSSECAHVLIFDAVPDSYRSVSDSMVAVGIGLEMWREEDLESIHCTLERSSEVLERKDERLRVEVCANEKHLRRSPHARRLASNAIPHRSVGDQDPASGHDSIAA